ncbi:hypothetical protein [Rickettsiella endosymbiont of Rhagonycha lignosa]|uniref:hypothetical protein n=1 Tax=Rickettsiella endosymbiont of Rhagonycha lignosa TaxID=3077937 RepID=UPI00313AD4FB
MQKSTDLNKRVSDKSSSENTIQKLPTETSSNSSEKTTSNEKKGFFNLFQRLRCSNTNLEDDKSEVVFKVPEFRPK